VVVVAVNTPVVVEVVRAVIVSLLHNLFWWVRRMP
jgi:hypothetical protein